MQFIVEIVGDHELPEGTHHAVVEREGHPPFLFINGDLARCWRTMRGYEARMDGEYVPSICVPSRPLLRAV